MPRVNRQFAVGALLAVAARAGFVALEPSDYHEHFVEGWPGPFANGTGAGVVNESSYEWAVENLPLFDSSDKDLVSAYYYRAKTYKSHLIPTAFADIKHVVSEFGPTVPWGGPYGTINAAAGHHLSEGRWIRDRSYMDGLVRFWVGSQAGGGPAGNTSSGAFEPGVGHFANGTRGAQGACAYSSWILTGAVKAAAVRGDLQLGADLHGHPVTYADVLPLMVKWWEDRSMQLRVDCIVANGGKTFGANKTCLDADPPPHVPRCYIMADGWDAMEGSVSGDGCRPTIGAMMIDEARAVATVARLASPPDAALAATFAARAEALTAAYLAQMWSEESGFFGVYKQGAEFSGMGGCTQSTLQNKSDGRCCCVTAERKRADPHYANFSVCEDPESKGLLPSPGNASQCKLEGTNAGGSTNWECGKAVPVRELLGLGPAYYHGIAPESASPAAGPTKYDAMWGHLFDAEKGLWGEYGPTTVERQATCFNKSQDTEECNWAGPSWPYETSRVLTGLARFLADYPPHQSESAGVTTQQYTKLLRTYARSMTHGNATNGSVPWVGENIEPDKGFWIAHSIQVNCSACEGTCWDREWSKDGKKCTTMNETLAKQIGPCGVLPSGQTCSCVPPQASYDYITHSSAPCCGWKESCDGKRMPTRDHDRGKDYNHSTFLDLIIEGLVGIRASLLSAFSSFSASAETGSGGAAAAGGYGAGGNGAITTTTTTAAAAAAASGGKDFVVVHPLADPAAIAHFALDNVRYHGRDLSVVWDPDGAAYPKAKCTGLCVFVDGKVANASKSLGRLEVAL